MLDDPRLEPMDESEMLESTVERWSDEFTVDEVLLLRVDSPIEAPARPVAPIAKPVGPLAPMSVLLLGEAPIS